MLGRRFGKLVVIEEQVGNTKYPVCLCECGRTRQPSRHDLEVGYAKSCRFCSEHGKYLVISENASDYRREREAWLAMVNRCHNPNHQNFRHYGARGIVVCDQWRESFESFYTDMGNSPGAGFSIDRIDNDGNYEPGNCRWATRAEQARNRRNNHFVTICGITATVTDTAVRLGLDPHIAFSRMNRGWSEERALTTPLMRRMTACK